MAASNQGLLEALHRITSISSGGLDTLPHNGAVRTLLAVSNCTHKESYIRICITTCIIPLAALLPQARAGRHRPVHRGSRQLRRSPRKRLKQAKIS